VPHHARFLASVDLPFHLHFTVDPGLLCDRPAESVFELEPSSLATEGDLFTLLGRVRDTGLGVAHPTKKSKKIAFGGQAAWFELEYTVATVATILVFVYSFIF
jgi:hypothetical protein